MKYVFIAFALIFFYSGNAQKAADYCHTAYEKLNTDDDGPGAILIFNKAIELDPKYALAYYGRADAKYMIQDYRGAIADYSKTIELDPKKAQAYYWRGKAKYSLIDMKGAIEDYNKAILLDPKNKDVYYSRGNTKYALSDFAGAIKDYDKVILMDPKYANAYYYRAVMNDKLKNYKPVIDDCTKAIELKQESSAICYALRGTAKINGSDIRGACADFAKAVELGNTAAAKQVKIYCQ